MAVYPHVLREAWQHYAEGSALSVAAQAAVAVHSVRVHQGSTLSLTTGCACKQEHNSRTDQPGKQTTRNPQLLEFAGVSSCL